MADAFGIVYRLPNLGVTDAFSFGGQWGYYNDWDSGLNIWLLTNRYYDPGYGRFLTADPIGYSGGGNRYRFVGNNPNAGADPSGLVSRGQYVAGGAALGGGAGAVAGSSGGLVGSAVLGTLAGTYGGMVGGSLYDSADDFGSAYGCYEGGRASGWQAAWAGTKAAWNVVSTVVFIRALAGGASAQPTVRNPIPDTFARAIPGDITPPRLGPPSREDVFVTAAEDIRGLDAPGISKRLAIPSAEEFTIYEFPASSVSEVATPINRTDEGFVGRGLTTGGAREFVIPNGAIPNGAVRRVVR